MSSNSVQGNDGEKCASSQSDAVASDEERSSRRCPGDPGSQDNSSLSSEDEEGFALPLPNKRGAACAACVAGTARRARRRRPFHAVRDADFVGSDPVVARALARRAPRGTLAPWRAPSAAELARLPLLPPPPAPQAPQARRWTRTNKTFPADPSLENVHAIQLRNMEQAIYSTQYRIMELEDILQEQQDDPRFRIAYLFKRLDEWCRDARVYYEYATRNATPNRWLTENFVIRRHIVYYSYILRRNVDVTYTIDYLLQMHEVMIKRTKTMNAEFDLMGLKTNSSDLEDLEP